MNRRKNRDGKAPRVKFALLSLLAAVVVVTLWVAFPTLPTAQAQEATADCGGATNPLHGRTQKIVDIIVSDLSAADCNSVTAAQLAGITALDLQNQSLSSIQSDDLAGLSGLTDLMLHNNSLTELPEDVFDGLTSLQQLRIGNNSLQALPPDLFDGLSSLQVIRMNGNSSLAYLPPDLFDGLSSLRELYFFSNPSLRCIHAGQFDGLSELRTLSMAGTKLGNIRPEYFPQWSLDQLTSLNMGDSAISNTGQVVFSNYQGALPALVQGTTFIRPGEGFSDPICGSISADTDSNNFHTTVRVRLRQDLVYPNRVRTTGNVGDGFCGSPSGQRGRELWTWQRSQDGLTWTNVAPGRQHPDYGTRTAGQCSFIYTPHADDNTYYIRAYVSVNTTGHGANDYHSAAFGPLNVQQ